MCDCSSTSCGCPTVKGRRGARGLQGPPGGAGTAAQVLQGDGPPSVDPTPATAYALYQDTATGGLWWEWTPGSPGAWTSGAPVSGVDGVDGLNAFTLTANTSPVIPGDGGILTLNVVDTSWMGLGQMLYLADNTGGTDFGYFQVFQVVSPTQVFVTNVRDAATGAYPDNANGVQIPVGSRVSPGGIQGPVGLPMVTSSGALAPTADPAGGASGWYVQSGTGGTYWYFNAPAGPWTDTGIDVIGPAGATGAAGANGYSPVTTTGTAVPAGGANGDVYFRQVNAGLIQVYTRPAGTWAAGITITSNRFIGSSSTNPVPNPGGLPVNAGDTYATQIGTTGTLYRWDGASWVVVWALTSGGGGGADTFQTVSDNSAGQLTGTRVWNMQRSIQYVPLSQSTVAVGATISFNTDYQHHKLTLLHDNAVIAYVDPGYDSDEWVFELTNGTAGELNFSYASTMWGANSGVTPPYTVPSGGFVSLVCRWVKGVMNIVIVQQNITML